MGKGDLVYPGVEQNRGMQDVSKCIRPFRGTRSQKSTVSNGAIMYPNTYFMQEVTRQAVDDIMACQKEGMKADEGFIYIIPKGTIQYFLTLFSLF